MKKKKCLTVLFVCTGNTCRSPMAQYLFDQELSRCSLYYPDGSPAVIKAQSAGIAACEGESASIFAQKAVAELTGREMDVHKALCVTKERIQEADIIFGMTDRHQQILQMTFPEDAKKIFSISSAIPDEKGERILGESIPDPFGGSEKLYAFTAEEIQNRIRELWPGILFFLGVVCSQ